MYVDECGNPDLKSSDNPIHRFLSLTGVIIDLDYVNSTLYRQIESLKSKYFGSHPDDPIILHRKEIVNAKHPFEVLRDKKIRKQFDTELLYFLKTWEYTVVSVNIISTKAVFSEKNSYNKKGPKRARWLLPSTSSNLDYLYNINFSQNVKIFSKIFKNYLSAN